MEIENVFSVPAPPDVVWNHLTDIPRVAPCLPGAEVTRSVRDDAWEGKVSIRLGAINLVYGGTVEVSSRDDSARTLGLRASGTETRGKGAASAIVTGMVRADENGGSHVQIVTDMTLSGSAAQFGRGMIADISRRLTDQFAECLKFEIERSTEPLPNSPARHDRIEGGRLLLWSLRRALSRLAARIFRGQAVDDD